jgi:hypothetical protein
LDGQECSDEHGNIGGRRKLCAAGHVRSERSHAPGAKDGRGLLADRHQPLGIDQSKSVYQAFQTMKLTAGFVAMGASAVFQALDLTTSGTVSKQAFVQGMTQLMAQFRSGGTSGR